MVMYQYPCGGTFNDDFITSLFYCLVSRWNDFLPARRCASVVFATTPCLSVRPSVCLSVCHKSSFIKTAERASQAVFELFDRRPSHHWRSLFVAASANWGDVTSVMLVCDEDYDHWAP